MTVGLMADNVPAVRDCSIDLSLSSGSIGDRLVRILADKRLTNLSPDRSGQPCPGKRSPLPGERPEETNSTTGGGLSSCPLLDSGMFSFTGRKSVSPMPPVLELIGVQQSFSEFLADPSRSSRGAWGFSE